MTRAKTTLTTTGDHNVLRWLTQRRAEMVQQLRELVIRESPTHDKVSCDALCAHLAEQFRALGGKVKVNRQAKAGNHLQVEFAGPREREPVLLLGHYDTVYDLGALKTMPWREMDGMLCGPGIFDMKAGIVQILFALRALREMKAGLPRPVTVWLVSDEETGSDSSRAITEKLASRCAAALVCEPSGPGGTVKTARKGVGGFVIHVTGRAAHSGLDFEKGQSAIQELAHQIHAISRLTDLKRGITLNVGVIRGGTRTNVVAGEASAEVDLRIARKSDGPGIVRKVKALRPVNRQCKLQIEGGVNRPPLERTAAVANLFQTAQKVAQELGFSLKEIAVGGGSDGNFTAGIGVPTLDGLGAVGDGAHASHEYVVAAELPRRAALLAGLIERV
jgi:glutamate carboxypeptidase